MKAHAAAIWLLAAAPHVTLMGCSSGNASRTYGDAHVDNGLHRHYGQRPATDAERICTPSEELAVTVTYGRVAGVEGTEEGKCTVFYNDAREIDYQVAVDKPAQCTPEGLAAFGHRLPKKPPVCRFVSGN